MKTSILTLAAASTILALSNCAQPVGPNTQRGAAIGGLSGAAIGGVVGHQSGNTVEGALIGGAVGAGAGALYGNSRDQQRYNRY